MSQTKYGHTTKFYNQEQNPKFIINELKQEIKKNPEMRHRIILKAIKTAESREAQKVIREFCRASYANSSELI